MRDWLDGFVATAEEYAAVRPEIRRAIAPPVMPGTSRRFASVQEFLRENPARALGGSHPRRNDDATGADFGSDWSWHDPEHPWIVSRWRVSYIDELKEVYALELQSARPRPFISFDERADEPPAVWLLASELDVPGDRSYWTSPTWTYLSELVHALMRQRNSLFLLAETLASRDAGEQ